MIKGFAVDPADLLRMMRDGAKKAEKKPPVVLGKMTPEQIKEYDALVEGGKEIIARFKKLMADKNAAGDKMDAFWTKLKIAFGTYEKAQNGIHLCAYELHAGDSEECLCDSDKEAEARFPKDF